MILLALLACGSPDPAPPVPATEVPATEVPATEAPTDEAPATAASSLPPLPADTRRFDLDFTDPPELTAGLSAVELNNAGHRYYEAGDLVPALKLFRAAVEAKPDYTSARYNRACVSALLRALGQTCEVETYATSILDDLRIVAREDPARQVKMRSDLDLASVRDALAFKLTAGLDATDPAALEAWLPGTTLYSRGVGAYGSTQRFTLEAGGAVKAEQLNVDDEPVWEPSTGAWRLVPAGVELTVFGATATYTLSAEGELVPTAAGGDEWLSFPSECEA